MTLKPLKQENISKWELLTLVAKKSLKNFYRFRNNDMMEPYKNSIMWSLFGFENSSGMSTGLFLIQSDKMEQLELTFIDRFDNFHSETNQYSSKITILKIINNYAGLIDFLDGIALHTEDIEQSDIDDYLKEKEYFLRELRLKEHLKEKQDEYDSDEYYSDKCYSVEDAFDDATDGQCEGESWITLGRD